MQQTVLLIYLTGDLGLLPATIGLVYSALGIAAVAGTVLANPCAEYFGKRFTLIVGTLAPAIGVLLIPSAIGTANPVPVLILAQMLIGVGASFYYVTDAAVRQALTPYMLMGRVSSIRSFVAGSFSPLGGHHRRRYWRAAWSGTVSLFWGYSDGGLIHLAYAKTR